MERDPVCGMAVAPERAAARVDYAGKTYYFCATGCARKFSADPGGYLEKATEDRGVGTPPPVFAAKPAGKDPVCGMTVNPPEAAARLVHGGSTYYFRSEERRVGKEWRSR